MTTDQAVRVLEDINSVNRQSKTVAILTAMGSVASLYFAVQVHKDHSFWCIIAAMFVLFSMVWWKLPQINYRKRLQLQAIIDDG